MKIIESALFFNENLVAGLKVKERRDNNHEFHFTEANCTFQGKRKEFCFNLDQPSVYYHRLKFEDTVRTDTLIDKLYYKTIIPIKYRNDFYKKNIYKSAAWYNDAMQRNIAGTMIVPKDNDIVVLSDCDEIIDRRYWDKIISLVKKHKIITIKIKYSLFFFNLFSQNWNGAPDYSYRIFIMTGKEYMNLPYSPDRLRKLGELGHLMNEIYCPNEFMGFHHSWIGDENQIIKKLNSYAHGKKDHIKDIYDKSGNINMEQVKTIFKEGRSIYRNHELKIDDSEDFLQSLTNEKDLYAKYFL